MNNKSYFTEILEEKIIELKGVKVKVSLVKTRSIHGRALIRTYSNFLRNDNSEEHRKETKILNELKGVKNE